MLERHIMKQIMGPTRSPSEPVGLHLEVELKPQLKSHVGQKMAAMLMTQVRNGRGQKLMGLARARDPRIQRAAGHASTITMSKSSPHTRTQRAGPGTIPISSRMRIVCILSWCAPGYLINTVWPTVVYEL